jgi:hypothetical protein
MSQPNYPPAELEFPKPPSFKDTQNDPAATLAWLEENISTIYVAGRTPLASQDKPPILARSAYLSLYTTAHNYCEITKHARSTKCGDPKPLSGEDLYNCLEKIIRRHCTEVVARLSMPLTAESTPAVTMIQEYLAQWNMLTQHLAPLVTHLLRHLERHCIQRWLDEKRKDVYLIRDLHTVIWKEEILCQAGGDSATTTAATTRAELEQAVRTLLQEEGEDGVESDRKDLAAQFLESLRSIGVDLKAGI